MVHLLLAVAGNGGSRSDLLMAWRCDKCSNLTPHRPVRCIICGDIQYVKKMEVNGNYRHRSNRMEEVMLIFKGVAKNMPYEVECHTYDQAKKLISELAKCSPDDIRMVGISEKRYDG